MQQRVTTFEPPPAKPKSGHGDNLIELLSDGRPKIGLPGDGREIGHFGAELGDVLAGNGFFQRGEMVVRLNEKADGFSTVTEQQLRTAIEIHCVCVKKKSEGELTFTIRKTMTADQARAVLASQQFREKMPPIARVNGARLPVLRTGGTTELLPPGYDEQSQTFTTSDIGGGQCEDGKRILDDLLCEFCFADNGRSKAVAVSAMLTVYGRGLLPGTALAPAFIYLANSEGAGKTLLGDCATFPVFGRTFRADFARRDEEMAKFLTAIAAEGQPVIFFDNAKGHLNSAAFERYLTGSEWTGRILGENRTFTGPADAVCFITGNGCTVSADLRRRALFCELFMVEDAPESRKFRHELSEEILQARREEILAALWALVREWDAAGRPPGTLTRPGVTEWGRIIGGIVENAGWASPLGEHELNDGGDTDLADIRKLIEAIDERHGGASIQFSELAELAAEKGLFGRIVGDDGKSLESSDRSKFGKLLCRYERRIFRNSGLRFLVEGKSRGRRFRVEEIENCHGATV